MKTIFTATMCLYLFASTAPAALSEFSNEKPSVDQLCERQNGDENEWKPFVDIVHAFESLLQKAGLNRETGEINIAFSGSLPTEIVITQGKGKKEFLSFLNAKYFSKYFSLETRAWSVLRSHSESKEFFDDLLLTIGQIEHLDLAREWAALKALSV